MTDLREQVARELHSLFGQSHPYAHPSNAFERQRFEQAADRILAIPAIRDGLELYRESEAAREWEKDPKRFDKLRRLTDSLKASSGTRP